MGLYDTATPARSPSTCSRRESGVHDGGQLFPGRVRGLVPEPPVADRRAPHRPGPVPRGRDRRPRTRSRTPTACRSAIRSTRRPAPTADSSLTESCPSSAGAARQPARVPPTRTASCGDWAVNTTQPFSQPYSPGTAPARRLPAPELTRTIGDRLSARPAGPMGLVRGRLVERGWGRVGEPGLDKQHGPRPARRECQRMSDPNSKANAHMAVLPGQPVPVPPPAVELLRVLCAHRCERRWPPARRGYAGPPRRAGVPCGHPRSSRKHCELRDVSIHQAGRGGERAPGYASEPSGSNHLVDLLRAVEGSRCRKDTMVIVTYDEFGGRWDHVPPPGQGGT